MSNGLSWYVKRNIKRKEVRMKKCWNDRNDKSPKI